ncbi:hypothetical protein ALC57_12649 [Trachymyrmex cornetzi]|uniref:Uncharacterized protein n=2 Tax=Trachymyrmex cornetzi TaxID=471704 RepID=A0A195DQL0_9HYME|nr:hypothetical protein ALC57_12649 [Trachymyrmex cornetzi]
MDIYPYFFFLYKWNIVDTYSSHTGHRSFNNQPSVPVEKSDNRKVTTVKGLKITVDEFINRTKLIVAHIKKFQKDAQDAVPNFPQNVEKANFDTYLLFKFVMMIHQWTSDVIVLNTVGKSYYEEILKLPKRCVPHQVQTNYTLQDRIVMSSDIISTIEAIQNRSHTKSKELSEKKGYDTMKRNSRKAELLIKLIKSIVFELNEKLKSKETIISSRLNKDILMLQLFAYKWVLNIRYPNIRKKSVNKKSQPPLKDESSLPMDKNDNGPTDQEKNAADILKRESRSSTTEGIDASTKTECEFKQIIHHTLEMKLFTFAMISHEWFTYEDSSAIIGGKSLNDFQLPLEDQSFSLPIEESSTALEDDEITIKDFMNNVKLTKRQINENLEIFEETIMDTDNESSQKLQNVRKHIHVKRSNVHSMKRHIKFLRLQYRLIIYRWVSNILIYNTIGKTSLGSIFPHLRECQPMFPVKETNEQLKEFEEISREIIYFIRLIQTYIRITAFKI